MVNRGVYLALFGVIGSIGLVSLYSYSLIKSSLSSKLNKTDDTNFDQKTQGDEPEFVDSASQKLKSGVV